MSDPDVVVTRRSWLNRLGDSLMGALIGLILVIAAVAMLWWNEGRSAWRIETLSEGRDAVVSVAAAKLDAGNDGKLVHISGAANAAKRLTDDEFGVSVNALRLKRTVEMYQWQQRTETHTTKNLGGSETTETIFKYDKIWSADLIDSTGFHNQSYRNPTSMPFSSKMQTAEDISVGAFRLTSAFTAQLVSFERLPVSDEMLARSAPSVREKLKRDGNRLVSGNAARPNIGDVRVAMLVVKPGPVSAVGKQAGGTLKSFSLPKGEISLLVTGEKTADEMFAKSESDNR